MSKKDVVAFEGNLVGRNKKSPSLRISRVAAISALVSDFQTLETAALPVLADSWGNSGSPGPVPSGVQRLRWALRVQLSTAPFPGSLAASHEEFGKAP